MYYLYHWSIVQLGSPYTAPELKRLHLTGVRNNEDFAVTTSAIVKAEGKKITTETGSVYMLEDIDNDYLEWMNAEGIVYDSDNPIKVRQ